MVIVVAIVVGVLLAPEPAFESATGSAAIEMLVGVAALVATLVLLGRYRDSRSVADLALVVGFGVAAVANLVLFTLPAVLDRATGLGSVGALELTTSILFATAAVSFALLWERTRDDLMCWLALGSLLLASSCIGYMTVEPSNAASISVGDLLRAAAVLMLLAGAMREADSSRRRQQELAVTEERRRLARELHDGVAQDLAFIVGQSMQLVRTSPEEPALRRIAAAAERALSDSRSAIYMLQQPKAHTLGAAIEGHAHEIAHRAGLSLTLDVAEGIETSSEIEHAVLRIIQEAISNAARHGEATAISISLSSREDEIIVRISDNGCGFDPTQTQSSKSGGFGLLSMSERIRLLGGEMRLESEPGHGTTIELDL